MVIVIANILGFLSGFFCLLSTFMKTKSRILFVQCVEQICDIISYVMLGALSGTVVTGIAMVRNLICRNRKASKPFIIFTMVITAAAVLAVNTNGIYGLIPVIASLSYAWVVMTRSDAKEILAGLVLNNLLWLFYKLLVMNYAGAAMNFVIISFSLYNMYKRQKA